MEEAAERARVCEAAALAVDKRLTNSEGAGVSNHTSHFIYANSLGFCNGYAGSRHGMSVAVIGEEKGAMQRDYWYTSARNSNDLDSAETVGRIAGARTVRRLNGRKLDTRTCPVIFEAQIATGLIGSFVGAVSKLGMTTTGNAGGSHNLIVTPGEHDLEGLLKQMGTGLLVTELLGSGANMVTGDYSRGAAGFWVENGEIQYPVEEITIAGNLAAMFKGIVGIGKDIERRSSKQVGSILIDKMTVAGN